MVRRLVFNGFAKHLTDELFSSVGACRNLERLTLPGATRLTSKSLNYVFGRLQALIAIDLAGVDAVNNYVVYQIANGCPQVQGLNLAKCHKITDEGVMAVAERSTMLRRVS
jgi:F-box and leucine-rich repeat protein GRR1